jgi:AraC-like DNA-binding protein
LPRGFDGDVRARFSCAAGARGGRVGLASWQQHLDSTSPIVGRVRETDSNDSFIARRFRRGYSRAMLDVVEVEGAHTVEHGDRHLQFGEHERLIAFQALAGECIVRTDSKDIEVPIGDLMLFSTAKPFTFVWAGKMASTYVYFPPSLLGLPSNAFPAITGSWLARRTPMGNIAADLLQSAAANLSAFSGVTGQLLTNNVIEVLRTAIIDEVIDKPANSSQVRFAQVAAHIDEHIGDPSLSVQGIAEAHYVSLRTLHAIFQSQGTSAASWIRVRRLERAGQMLRDPALAAMTIGEIAESCGFDSASYFSVAFRAHFNTTPTQWRRAEAPLA